MDTEAIFSKKDGLTIQYYPHVVLSSDATEEQIQMAHKSLLDADKLCDVGNLLKKAGSQIEVEGKVTLISDDDLITNYVEVNGLE